MQVFAMYCLLKIGAINCPIKEILFLKKNILAPIITFTRVVVEINVIFINLLSFSYKSSKMSYDERLKCIKHYSGKMKILPNLLTVDSDRPNFPLHVGI